MPSFNSVAASKVGTTAVDLLTVNKSNITIFSLTMANLTANQIIASVYITRNSKQIYVIKNAPIPPGSTVVPIGGVQKVVLKTSDKISVISTIADSVDVIASYLESDS